MSKFDFKKKYLIIYLCLIVFDTLLMLFRWLEHIAPNVRLLPDFLLDHITNFALCMLLLLIFGITVLSFGGKLRSISVAALVMSVLNIVYGSESLPTLLSVITLVGRKFVAHLHPAGAFTPDQECTC